MFVFASRIEWQKHFWDLSCFPMLIVHPMTFIKNLSEVVFCTANVVFYIHEKRCQFRTGTVSVPDKWTFFWMLCIRFIGSNQCPQTLLRHDDWYISIPQIQNNYEICLVLQLFQLCHSIFWRGRWKVRNWRGLYQLISQKSI